MCVVDTEYLLNRAEPTLESLSTLAQSCDRFSHDDNGKGIHWSIETFRPSKPPQQ